MTCFSPQAKSLSQGFGAGVGTTVNFSPSDTPTLGAEHLLVPEVLLVYPSWSGTSTLESRCRFNQGLSALSTLDP